MGVVLGHNHGYNTSSPLSPALDPPDCWTVFFLTPVEREAGGEGEVCRPPWEGTRAACGSMCSREGRRKVRCVWLWGRRCRLEES